jgi:hypothetical protein
MSTQHDTASPLRGRRSPGSAVAPVEAVGPAFPFLRCAYSLGSRRVSPALSPAAPLFLEPLSSASLTGPGPLRALRMPDAAFPHDPPGSSRSSRRSTVPCRFRRASGNKTTQPAGHDCIVKSSTCTRRRAFGPYRNPAGPGTRPRERPRTAHSPRPPAKANLSRRADLSSFLFALDRAPPLGIRSVPAHRPAKPQGGRRGPLRGEMHAIGRASGLRPTAFRSPALSFVSRSARSSARPVLHRDAPLRFVLHRARPALRRPVARKPPSGCTSA